jgi:hypothetical protein
MASIEVIDHTSTEAGVWLPDNLSELPEAAPVEFCPTESVRSMASEGPSFKVVVLYSGAPSSHSSSFITGVCTSPDDSATVVIGTCGDSCGLVNCFLEFIKAST